MKNFRAEVGELRRFLEADGADAVRVGTDARVGGHHAVNVSPNLDRLSIESGAYDGSGEIGASAPQSRRNTFASTADETSHYGNLFTIEQGADMMRQAQINFGKQWNSLGVIGIGNHALTRIHVRSRQIAAEKCRSHHAAGDALTERSDQIRSARRELSNGGNAAQQFVEGIEVAFEFRMELSKNGSAEQLSGCRVMPLAQPARKL